TEGRWLVERAGFYGHRFSGRILFEISPLPEFVPGLCAGPLFEPIPQSGRIPCSEVAARRSPAAKRVLERMMRFPLRLSADLILAQLAQKLRGPAGVSPVLYMDSMEHAEPSGREDGKSPAKRNAGTDLLACV